MTSRTWADGPTGNTPLTAAMMNGIEADLDARMQAWKAGATYAAGQPVVNPSGDVVTAVAAFTSGTSYNAANWKASGTLAQVAFLPANARYYGAVGDGQSRPMSTLYATLAAAQAVYPAVTALTDELDWAAITKTISTRGGAYLPDTTKPYVINKPISISGAQWIQGDPSKSSISQTANNTQIIQVTGTPRVENLILDYTRQQTSSETTGTGVELTNVGGGSVLRNLSIRRCARAIYNAGGGYTFSTSITDIDINGFSISGLDISNSGGITGNVLQNLYIHNNYYGSSVSSTAAPVVLSGWDDGVINQMNIEYCQANQMVTFNQVRNLTVAGLHMEGDTMLGLYGGLIELVALAADRVHMSGVSVINNTFASGTITSGMSGVFKVTNGSGLEVTGLSIRGNTVTIANMALVYVATGASGSANVELTNVQTDASWRDVVGDQPQLIALRVYGTDTRWSHVGGTLEVAGTAAPTTGTWAVGDSIYNTAPSQQGTAGSMYITTGWDCITAGTPGTWVPRRALTGN